MIFISVGYGRDSSGRLDMTSACLTAMEVKDGLTSLLLGPNSVARCLLTWRPTTSTWGGPMLAE